MNLTIPIRAQSSTSSRLRLPRGNALVNNNKADRKRYIFSMITATLLIGTLIVSSVGGVMHSAFARDNFSGNNYTKQGRDARQTQPTSQTTPTTTKPVATVTPTPPVTPTVTPAVTPAVQPAATTTPAPATTQASAPVVQPAATPQIVAQPAAPAPPAPIDTAPAIANMTAAQAEKAPQAVVYSSSRLSDETKNRLLILAAVAAVTGALLYTMSVIGSTVPTPRRQLIPVRYIVPVQEGSTR